MNIELKPIDYLNMTWKQVFETFQSNIDTLYQAILASYTDVEVEQFSGPGSQFTIQSPADEDTEWLVFVNNDYLGKRDGGDTYSVDGQVITFDPPLEGGDQLTILITNGNGIAVLANHYVAEIKHMYDTLSDLDIDITKQIENVTALKDYLDESALGILDAKTVCASYKDYIEELLSGSLPPPGDVSAEIVAARRGYDLLGARLDTFVSTALEKDTFLASTRYHDGDWVLVKDSKSLYLFWVKDNYEGSDQYIRLLNGQYAVILTSIDSYTTMAGFEERIEAVEDKNQEIEGGLSELTLRVDGIENNLIVELNARIEDLTTRLKAMEDRKLLDLDIVDAKP